MGDESQVPVSTAAPGILEVGYNYPVSFNHFGTDIGPFIFDTSKNKDTPFFKDTLVGNLTKLRALKINKVRWFLLGNGINYGPEPTKIKNVGLGKSGKQWRFDPPAKLDPLFLDNFEVMLRIFQEEQMQLLPSFIDFKLAVARDGPGGGGRADVINDATKRHHFMDTVFKPLLRISRSFRKQIFAWEVINEPVWLTLFGSLTTREPVGRVVPDDPPDVDFSTMLIFLNEALAILRSEEFNLPSTVGHRFFSDLSKLPTGDIRQFHYYGKDFVGIFGGDPKIIPDFDNSNAFIGEFAAQVDSDGIFQGLFKPGTPWNECNGADKVSANTVFERLKVLKGHKYRLAFVWPDGRQGVDFAVADPLKLSDEKIASLKKFTVGPP